MEENNKEAIKMEKSIKMSNDKKIIIGIVAAMIIIAGSIFGWFFYDNNLRPVAKFNGGSLTVAEYTLYYKTFAPMLEYYGYPADIIPEQIANKAAVDKIILSKAKAENVNISEENKKIVDDIFNDESQVKKFQEQGIDPAEMKKLYYNDYVITEYINKMKKDLTDEEVTKYIKETYGENPDMNEYATKQILLKNTNAETGEALDEAGKTKVKAKAQSILDRAQKGEDFVALVKEFSEDTGTKEVDGDYKVYADSKTVKEYQDAVLKMNVGDIVLVESTYGYHIIKLNAKNENGRLKSDSEREDISSKKIDALAEEYKLDINKDRLTKVVEEITGKKQEDSNTDSTGTPNNGENDETHTLDDGHNHTQEELDSLNK